MGREKEEVRRFYETFGWKRRHGADYGEATFNDLRAVTAAYNYRSNLRVRSALPKQAKLFLDAACGARPQSLLWNQPWGIERQVCVDMSRVGLGEARSKLGGAGLYVEADLTALPFRDGVFDGFICAYALFHVPAAEQESVVRELYRTLAPGGTGVVLYCPPDSPMNRWARRYSRLRNRVLRRSSERATSDVADDDRVGERPDLYWHAFEYTWWSRFPREWNIELRSLASVDQEFTTSVIPDSRLGLAALRFVSFLEERFPRGMMKLGRYPMVIIRKAETRRQNALSRVSDYLN